MDELDSQFPFDPMDSRFNFHFGYTEICTPFIDKEETPIDTHHTVQNELPDDHQSENETKRVRVDNNIFKTPLSDFRKKKIHPKAFDIINEGGRNFSIFPKYWLLCEKLGFKDQLRELFKEQMSSNLEKKRGKMSSERYDELQRVYERMNRSLECTELEQAMREYWGRFRQKSKFLESFEEIRRFQKVLETII